MVITPIYEWAHRNPNKTAIVWNGVPVTYARFAHAIENVRQTLIKADLPVGSTAVLVIRSLLDGWTVVMALRALGVNTVSVASIEAGRALELRDVSCVVIAEDSLPPGGLEHIPWPGARMVKIPADLYAHIPPGEPPELSRERHPQGGHLLYTSGTTGSSKKLLQSGAEQASRNARLAACYAMTPEHVWHVAYLGMWTAIGFKIPLAVWHAGGSVVFDQRTAWAERFFQQRITHAMLIPHMVDALLKARDLLVSAPPRGGWGLAVTAGFMPARMAQAARDRLTDDLTLVYGSTELCSRAMDAKVTQVEDMHWMSPSDGRLLEIVDDDGRLCPPGTEGCLRIRSTPLDSCCYLDDPLASDKVFRDGCFYPGDMAVAREDGRIRVLGRSADVLNLKGQKIATAPIEQKFQEKLEGRTVCLFSGINRDGQDEITVAMESDRSFGQDEMDGLAAELKDYGHVRFRTVKEFPMTTTGTRKIDRLALRKLLFSGSD